MQSQHEIFAGKADMTPAQLIHTAAAATPTSTNTTTTTITNTITLMSVTSFPVSNVPIIFVIMK